MWNELVRPGDRADAQHLVGPSISHDAVAFFDGARKSPYLIYACFGPVVVFGDQLVPPVVELGTAQAGHVAHLLPTDGDEAVLAALLPLPGAFPRRDLPVACIWELVFLNGHQPVREHVEAVGILYLWYTGPVHLLGHLFGYFRDKLVP